MRLFIEAGFKPLHGFNLLHLYSIDPAYRQRLTVLEAFYSAITDARASYVQRRTTRHAPGHR